MAGVPRCLCLILALLMVGSRPSAIIGTGSMDSDPWWGTKEAHEIRRAAEQSRAVRNFAAAETADQRGLALARRRHDDRAAFVYLASIGAVRLEQSQYRAALEALLEARDLAERTNDATELGAISVNLSSLYLQIWDTDSARRIAEGGLSRARSLPKAYFRLPLLLQLGRVHQTMGDGRASEFYLRAIEEARAEANVAQEARGWDLLGEERLRSQALAAADADFTEAFRLRVLEDRADLMYSYARLGAVKLAESDRKQRELSEAQRFTDRALEMSGRDRWACRFTCCSISAAESVSGWAILGGRCGISRRLSIRRSGGGARYCRRANR